MWQNGRHNHFVNVILVMDNKIAIVSQCIQLGPIYYQAKCLKVGEEDGRVNQRCSRKEGRKEEAKGEVTGNKYENLWTTTAALRMEKEAH